LEEEQIKQYLSLHDDTKQTCTDINQNRHQNQLGTSDRW